MLYNFFSLLYSLDWVFLSQLCDFPHPSPCVWCEVFKIYKVNKQKESSPVQPTIKKNTAFIKLAYKSKVVLISRVLHETHVAFGFPSSFRLKPATHKKKHEKHEIIVATLNRLPVSFELCMSNHSESS